MDQSHQSSASSVPAFRLDVAVHDLLTHTKFIGGEPLIRRRELNRILHSSASGGSIPW
jgi:hypothetical protein